MLPRILSPAVAFRLLRTVLPLCLVAGTAVAVLGLVRVVGTGNAAPVAEQSPSLRLGAAGGGHLPAALPSHPAQVPQQAAKPAASTPPRPSAQEQPPLVPVTRAVDVMNASGVSGLAGRTATLLRAQGVTVASVGNLSPGQRGWRGNGPISTTVFYPPGGDLQARSLATMAHVPDVAPAPQWLSAQGRLVLVVTATHSGSSARS